jgi:hypothetical protein
MTGMVEPPWLAAALAATLAGHPVVYVPHAWGLVVALSACAGGSALLVWRHTALRCGGTVVVWY